MIYIAIYVILASSAYGFRYRRRDGQKLYSIYLVLLFLFCAFRYEIGCDWTGYENQFQVAEAQVARIDSVFVDPLWWLMVDAVRRLGLSYPWLNVAATAILFAGIHIVARRQPDRLAFLALLFPILIVHIGMSGIRQAAAIGFLCVAFVSFTQSRTIPFIVLVLIASLIHSSAMVFMLLAPLVNGPYSQQRIAFAVMLAVPGALFMLESPAAEVAATRYIDSGLDAAGAALRVGLLVITGGFFFWIMQGQWKRLNSPDYKLVSLGSILMIGLAVIVPISTVIADRLAYYFIPLQAIIFARIPFLRLGYYGPFYSLCTYGILGLTLTVWVWTSEIFVKCYTPYQSWLFGAF